MRVPTSRVPHPLTDDKKTSETYNVDPDVRQVREEYGLSQDKFAKLMGIGLVTFQNWEEGRRQPELLARILLRVATRVHPRVLVASWLAVGLMVGIADRVHHQNSLFPIFFHLLGFVFGFVGCLVFVTGILLLHKRVKLTSLPPVATPLRSAPSFRQGQKSTVPVVRPKLVYVKHARYNASVPELSRFFAIIIRMFMEVEHRITVRTSTPITKKMSVSSALSPSN